jgi:hypothetical protein
MLIKKMLEKRSGKIMTGQITAENNGDEGGGNAPALTAPTVAVPFKAIHRIFASQIKKARKVSGLGDSKWINPNLNF